MFGGHLDLQLLIYSLIFTIPGTPILWYGEEIGMAEDLNLEERNSVLKMRWKPPGRRGILYKRRVFNV
jgi:glycosidase